MQTIKQFIKIIPQMTKTNKCAMQQRQTYFLLVPIWLVLRD